ncbi:MAG: fatty acid desaturase, partial [Rhizobium sp.]
MTRTEWPTLALIALCYGLWLAAGLWLYPRLPALALIVMGIAVAFHSSLQHEVLHGHPTRSARLNEALVFPPIGLLYPFRSYKRTHLQHHLDERLTDPHDDPESYYIAFFDWLRLPRLLQLLLKANNTLLGRVLLGPPLNVVGFTRAEWKRVARGDAHTRDAWVRHILGLVPVILLVQFGFGVPIWLYALTAGYLGLALLAV